MTQPNDRRQIAATHDGQPIFVPRPVPDGDSQPIGELADGQPVWPLPAGTQPQAGPVPFGLSSTGQPVWAQPMKASRPFYKKKRVLIPAAFVVLLGFAGAGGDSSSTDTVEASKASAAEVTTSETSAADKAAADKAAADKAAADKAAADKAAADKAAADKAAADKAAADKAAADKAAADKAVADKAAAEKAAADKAAADKAAAEKAAEAAKGTLSQQNAYDSAASYLGHSAFSRTGLVQQLSSEYGEAYPLADAEFAVARLEREGGVDWNAEAAESAQSYLSHSSFSRQGLLDQLTSEHGEGFTPEQAEYGVSQTGL